MMLLKVKGIPVGTPKRAISEAAEAAGGKLVEVHLRGEQGAMNGIVVMPNAPPGAAARTALRNTFDTRLGTQCDVNRLPANWTLKERHLTTIVNVAVMRGAAPGPLLDSRKAQRKVQELLESRGVKVKLARGELKPDRTVLVMVELDSRDDAERLVSNSSPLLDAVEVHVGPGGPAFVYGDQCQQRKRRIYTAPTRTRGSARDRARDSSTSSHSDEEPRFSEAYGSRGFGPGGMLVEHWALGHSDCGHYGSHDSYHYGQPMANQLAAPEWSVPANAASQEGAENEEPFLEMYGEM